MSAFSPNSRKQSQSKKVWCGDLDRIIFFQICFITLLGGNDKVFLIAPKKYQVTGGKIGLQGSFKLSIIKVYTKGWSHMTFFALTK